MSSPDSSTLVAQPSDYVNGLNISYFIPSAITLGPGICRDSTNTFDMNLSSPLAVSLGFNGANGLDTGTAAINTWYAVYLIFDPTFNLSPAGLLSTSAIAPIMPSVNGTTYTAFRRIGWMLTQSGAAHVVQFAQTGNGAYKYYQWVGVRVILSNGSATTYTGIDCSTAAPPQVGPVYLNSTYNPKTTASIAAITTNFPAPLGIPDPTVAPIILQGDVSAVPYNQSGMKIITGPAPLNALQYQVTASDTLSLWVSAFEDSL